MKENLSYLNRSWKDYKNNSSNCPFMTYRYLLQEQEWKSKIADALTFWQFVRKEVGYFKRQDFCRQFLNDKNYLIRIVARIEILPDAVWRKILWVKNIDFMSYESTLRRLTEDQINSINEAFDSLENSKPKLPKVFLVNIFDIIKVFLGLITVKKLILGTYGDESRWYSKGAWAFNLLSLDFGFSLYPGGVNDDIKITNKKFSRFLSIKEHINDFIVNQEDGLYWKLYKSARSNYVWFPKKEVELSTHVCPGFWKTLVLHLLFWIVSPIGFTLLLIYWINTGIFPFNLDEVSLIVFIGNILMIIPFILTPLWIAIALIKIFFTLIGKLLLFVIPPLADFFEYFSEKAVKILKKIGKFVSFIIKTKTGDLICRILIILLGISVIVLATWLVCFLAIFVWHYLVIFYLFIVKIITSLILNIKTFPLSYIWGAISIVALVFFVKIFISTMFDDEKYAKYDKIIPKFSGIWLVIAIIVGYFAITKENVFFHQSDVIKMIFTIIVMFAFISVLTLWMATVKINTETLDKRLNSKFMADYLNDNLLYGKQSIVPKMKRIILDNEWILYSNRDSYEKVLDQLCEIVRSNYHLNDNEERRRFMFLVLPKLNLELLNKLSKKKVPKGIELAVDKLYFVNCLCSGFSYAEATKKTKRNIAFRNKKDKVLSKRAEQLSYLLSSMNVWLKKWIFRPILYLYKLIVLFFVGILYKGIVSILSWIYKSSLTLKDIWSLFNERCPFISKSELLE